LPDALIIRYHGDHFIVLNKTYQEIDTEKLSQYNLIKDGVIDVGIIDFEIDKYFNYERFKVLGNQT